MPVTIGRTALEGCRILGITPEQAGIELHKPTLPPKRRDLADTFAVLWERFGPYQKYPMVREYRFHPTRRFRFDCCWPPQKVVAELEGGLWVMSRHRTGTGYQRDMVKYNLATSMGFRVLRYSANDLDLSPIQTIQQVICLLESKP